MSKKGIVVFSRASDYPDPLLLMAGDEVEIGTKKSPWPGWAWITASGGKSGWIPGAFVSRRGARGVVLRYYDATELDVEKGEELVLHEEVAGWYWCTNRAGRRGWVPVENVTLLSTPE
jgi:uncharacterized protein YgiM (DUF1202 family)